MRNILEEPCNSHGSVVHRLIRQLRGQVIIVFDLRDLDVLLVASTELTLHFVDPPREISQHALDVADVNLFLLEVLLQVSDPLFMTTGELFRLTLLFEIVVEEFSMTVRPPVQGLRVGVDPIHERIPHLLLTGDKGPNTHWVHGKNIEITVNM